MGTTRLGPGGLCASHGDAKNPMTVYDLVTGGKSELPPMAAFEWMP